MPKLNKTNATVVIENPEIQQYEAELGDYTVSIVSLPHGGDLAPVLAGLPNDQCHCTHFGYVLKGSHTFTYSDHTETFEAGDAYVATPGHTPSATPGSEFVNFSITEEFAPVAAHIRAKMAAMQG